MEVHISILKEICSDKTLGTTDQKHT